MSLELGSQYYFIGFGLALGLSSGTISLVSRFVGAGEPSNANFTIKQSPWIVLVISVPLTLVTWVFAEEMVGLLTDDPATIRLNGIHLQIVMVSVSFRFWCMIAARALQGTSDTQASMYVRLVTIPINLGLNAVFIFGLGPFPRLDVAGAAWGTTIANMLAACAFAVIMVSGAYSVPFPLGGRQWDSEIAREIVRVGYPLSGMQLIRTFGRFPFLFILTSLGTSVVAA